MISITHTITKDTIELHKKNLELFLNHSKVPELKYIHLQFLSKLLQKKGALLSYDEIDSMLYEHNPNIYNTTPYIRKIKHTLCKILKKRVPTLPPLIETVPKLGYKIVPLWKENQKKFEKELNELLTIIKDTIALCENFEIIKKNKKTFLKINLAEKESIERNIIAFAKLSQEILFSLNSSSQYAKTAELLEEIKSYISFQRVGGDIQEELWRAYFSNELLILYKNLILILQTE